MDTPNVTHVTAGAGGAFVAILTLAIQSGVTGRDLMTITIGSAIVACSAMLNDALIRRGRAGILASELHGLQANAAVFGATHTTSESEGVD